MARMMQQRIPLISAGRFQLSGAKEQRIRQRDLRNLLLLPEPVVTSV